MKLYNANWPLLLLFFLALTISGFGQSPSWNPERYYGISDRDKVLVFWDEFENNAHRWKTNHKHTRQYINGEGDYIIETLPGKSFINRKEVDLDPYGDFEVELRIRYTRGPKHQPLSLVFGSDGRGKEFRFQVFPGNAYRLVQHTKGKYVALNDKTISPVVEKYAYNAVMVRRVGKDWHFFINQEYLGSLSSQPLFGKFIGIGIGAGQSAEIDFLKVSQLKEADFFGPDITLYSPDADPSGMLHFTSATPGIAGKVEDESGIKSLAINQETVQVGPDGSFFYQPDLNSGYNKIEIQATDERFNTSRRSYYTVFKPEPPAARQIPSPSAEPLILNDLGSGRDPVPAHGQNYLLIGIDMYSRWDLLHNAVKDCEDVAGLLTRQYTFEPENIFRVYNTDATRENILETFEALQKRITRDDNLLVYFAGHGYYDKHSTLGYWVPVNSRKNKIPDFIRNSTVQDYIKTINAQHTLLIADACYAGSLFSASRSVINVNNKSRWAFTSGDIEKVWDGRPGGNSPFAEYLIRFLQVQPNNYVKADDLIKAVSEMVSRNTDQTPVGSPLQNVGDEGGVFVFFRK